jgi:uncharacterized protein YkwD
MPPHVIIAAMVGLLALPAGAPAAESDTSALERSMFGLLNADRAKEGLPPLAYDEEAADVARGHSLDMREGKFFAHESPRTGALKDRLEKAGILFSAARENLGEASDVETTQAGLMKSPGHHANIMAKDVSRVGIGIVRGGVKDPRNILATQVFLEPWKSETAGDARKGILAAVAAARRKKRLEALPPSEKLDALAAAEAARWKMPLDDRQIAAAGEGIVAALKKEKVSGRVSVGAQVTGGSADFRVPGELLKKKAAFGLAVREDKDAGGRPVVMVLVLTVS